MVSVLLCTLLVTGQASPASPAPANTPARAGKLAPPKSAPSNLAPLNDEQLAKLRELVRTTQATAERARQELADRERQLAEKYAQFELDEAGAEKLQAEVVELQQQLLANYHHLQVELRKIVGAERFAQLKLRLDHALRPKAKIDEPRGAPPTNSPVKTAPAKTDAGSPAPSKS